jgi:thioredoxin-disulfide reductase
MHDTVIIGAGIAGLTAAIYASRKRMDYVIVASEFGGQFTVSGEVLNYPGIVQTTGVDFLSVMKEQMDFNGVKVSDETVKEVRRVGADFKVVTDKSEYDTQTVIIATGARPRKLGVTGEKRLARKGVTYCSICDGPLFNGMDVAIIGGGDAALEAVDFMKDIAAKIYVLTNEPKFRAHEYLQEKVRDNPKVESIFNANIKEIVGEKFVSGIKYDVEGAEKILDVKGVIIEIGRVPNTEPFKGFVELDDHDHVVTDCRARTSVPGVFAVGDCAGGHEYQYVIAAGQGCMALIKAARYLAIKKEV